MRVGVGDKRPGQDLAVHVLSHFPAEQAAQMREAEQTAAEAIVMLMTEGLEKTMSRYNRRTSV